MALPNNVLCLSKFILSTMWENRCFRTFSQNKGYQVPLKYQQVHLEAIINIY